MFRKPALALILLTAATLACGIQAKAPATNTTTSGITEEISVDAPKGAINLSLSFGAGDIAIGPGSKKLVEGSASYNIANLKPEITIEEGNVNISQHEYQVTDFPTVADMKNKWELKLGSMPMTLNINAGAYKGNLDLGGLALKNLNINDGASEVKLDFSTPNLEKMNFFSYKTGASNVTIKNLSNANFSTFQFESGAGNYTLDFGGTLKRDSSSTIHSGISNLTLVIPATMNAIVKVGNSLSNIQFPDSWEKNGDIYTQHGDGAVMTIIIEMGVGNVQITH